VSGRRGLQAAAGLAKEAREGQTTLLEGGRGPKEESDRQKVRIDWRQGMNGLDEGAGEEVEKWKSCGNNPKEGSGRSTGADYYFRSGI
jgi:hypothetical protein